MMKRISRLALMLLLGLAASSSFAQNYPSKPVRIIVPFLPGGGVDVLGRAFAQKFTEAWGQQFIVDNRAGAGGNIGADAVAKSAPDGYTLLVTTAGLAVAPGLYRKLPFDALKDFAPTTQVISTYLVLAVNPRMPGTFKELIALAKSHPGTLNFGHTGLGSGPHIAGEMLRAAAAINIVMVPYKGDAQAVPALLSNEVQLEFPNPTTAVQLVKSGKLRALAVTGTSRGGAFPDVPTTAELGYPDINYVGWVSFFAPAGTPHDILEEISSETARALRMPDIVERLPGWGGEAAGTTPAQFAAKYRADIARYTKIIREANIPLVD